MAGKPWSKDELLLALNLYYRIPFGRQHKSAPEVIELARVLDRTPSSVAMKLNNFTSLDPDEAARGVRGLPGASTRDRDTWTEFHADWEAMTAQSEHLWEQALGTPSSSLAPTEAVQPAQPEPASPIYGGSATEAFVPTKVRLAQSFFRRTVLAAYNYRCCITGLDVPELLRASHIVPWSEDPSQRLNPRNGLCLSALHDAAFDRHLISFTPDEFRLVLSLRLKQWAPNEVLQREFIAYEGRAIVPPERFPPAAELLRRHQLHGA